MLASLDAKIAFSSFESSAERRGNNFTNDTDFEHLKKIVSQCDVVFQGLKSIECEKGAFRVASYQKIIPPQEPEWIIFTKTKTNLNEKTFNHPFWAQQGIKKHLFCLTPSNLNDPPMLDTTRVNAEFIKTLGNLSGLFKYLQDNNKNKVALLGGGELNQFFWEQNLVDELYLTLSPIIIGGSTPSLFGNPSILKRNLSLKSFEEQNNFLFLNYEVKKSTNSY